MSETTLYATTDIHHSYTVKGEDKRANFKRGEKVDTKVFTEEQLTSLIEGGSVSRVNPDAQAQADQSADQIAEYDARIVELEGQLAEAVKDLEDAEAEVKALKAQVEELSKPPTT